MQGLIVGIPIAIILAAFCAWSVYKLENTLEKLKKFGYKKIIRNSVFLAYISAVVNCLCFNFLNDDSNTGIMSALIFINFLVSIIYLYRIINLNELKKSIDNYIYIIFMHSVLIVAQVLARNDVGFRPKELNLEVQATILIAILWCLDILMLTQIFTNLNSAIIIKGKEIVEQVERENTQLFGSQVYSNVDL